MAILATTAVTLRFISRKEMRVAISYDDFSMLFALMLCLGLCLLDGLGVRYGGTGRHTLAVGSDHVRVYIKLCYAFQILYLFCVTTVRISILLFYLRIFPKEVTSVLWKRCFYTVTALNLACFVTGLGAAIFICTPISFFWNQTGRGHCVNLVALLYSGASLGILMDIAVLVLPMPIVWTLQMKRSKKIGVMGVFLLGGFHDALDFELMLPGSACIASIIRMCFIHQYEVLNPTCTYSFPSLLVVSPLGPIFPYPRPFLHLPSALPGSNALAAGTQMDTAIWSTVEPCVAVISACLPVIGPCFRRKLVPAIQKSWLTRSKRSGDVSTYTANVSDPRKQFSPSLQQKPVVNVTTVYSRETQSDEEMAMPLREIEGQVR
ncbi:MAG: hypothetical protein Q9183_000126 [Haloplaca sp. 2 TL-2023]